MTAATAIEYGHIDFANDEVPQLHSILADLRRRHAVAPVQYHGEVSYMITRFQALQDAMSDDERFPSSAAYLRQSAPSMGKTIQLTRKDRVALTAYLESL